MAAMMTSSSSSAVMTMGGSISSRRGFTSSSSSSSSSRTTTTTTTLQRRRRHQQQIIHAAASSESIEKAKESGLVLAEFEKEEVIKVREQLRANHSEEISGVENDIVDWFVRDRKLDGEAALKKIVKYQTWREENFSKESLNAPSVIEEGKTGESGVDERERRVGETGGVGDVDKARSRDESVGRYAEIVRKTVGRRVGGAEKRRFRARNGDVRVRFERIFHEERRHRLYKVFHLVHIRLLSETYFASVVGGSAVRV